ncbi:hypothetical protein Daesc_002134 [Daldinia eschscholtzii]|uniref:Uncharacterized protein n=1 Tax=Daldinia eschscholtzii TaxID=292717 RepID=A0AAX6MWP5_9PEZI
MAPPHQIPQQGAQRQQGLPGADTPEVASLRRASSFRGGSRRGRGRGRPGGRGGNRGGNRNSQLPQSASAGVLGRSGQAPAFPPTAQQPAISSPFNTTFQQRPSGLVSSRQLSAGFTTNGPPCSQPTTGYSTVAASAAPRLSAIDHPNPLRSHPTQEYLAVLATGSREQLEAYIPTPLRHLQTTSNPPPPSASTRQTAGPQPSRALLPVPESSGATTSSVTAPVAGVIPRFRAENLNPYLSDVDLGTKHRDSLEISSIKKVPKRTPPKSAKPKFNFDELSNTTHTQTIPELPEYMPEIVKKEIVKQKAEQKVPAPAPVPAPVPASVPAFDRPLLPRPPPQQLPKQTFQSTGNLPFIDLPRIQQSQPQQPQQLQQQLPQPTPRQMPNYRAEKRSGIPKSRTFNALSNLTSSFSRASLFDRSNNNTNKISSSTSRSDLRRHIGSPIMAPPPPPFDGGNISLTEGNASSSASTSSGAAVIMTPQLSLSSTPSPAIPTKPVQRNPRMVYSAESQSYWTGRFVAMQDKLRNENLRGRNLNIITAAISEQNQQQSQAQAASAAAAAVASSQDAQKNTQLDGAFPTSYSMACMPGVTAQLLSGEAVAVVQAASEMTDDDNRIRRVFRHLEALCANRSALDSMHEFQQDYARLVGKKGLLPPGSSWDDNSYNSNNRDKDKNQDNSGLDHLDKDREKKGGPGWVGRIFSGSSAGSNGKKK